MSRLIRDSIDSHQLTIGFAKRMRGNVEGPEPCDRDAKLILLILFHGADICCPKTLVCYTNSLMSFVDFLKGLDLFEIRDCVPKQCLEQIYSLVLKLIAELEKAPMLGKRVVGTGILWFR